MSRPISAAPANVLRAALSATYPIVRAAGEQVVREAYAASATTGEVATRLGLSRRALERLRADVKSAATELRVTKSD